ncbi:hypothetical protein CEXT_395541 [Caerostris extrusa]|uniref:Uncharacterized protein n=1 Tax=Caerostris extrusa TaxID=172846 RepID=A0AAV4TCS1_CAEEX|nr:hypothetical protein CEXT_395541 [Caerostris extrusa]
MYTSSKGVVVKSISAKANENFNFFLQLQKASADHKVQSAVGLPGCPFMSRIRLPGVVFPHFIQRGLSNASWQERSKQRWEGHSDH